MYHLYLQDSTELYKTFLFTVYCMFKNFGQFLCSYGLFLFRITVCPKSRRLSLYNNLGQAILDRQYETKEKYIEIVADPDFKKRVGSEHSYQD